MGVGTQLHYVYRGYVYTSTFLRIATLSTSIAFVYPGHILLEYDAHEQYPIHVKDVPLLITNKITFENISAAIYKLMISVETIAVVTKKISCASVKLLNPIFV